MRFPLFSVCLLALLCIIAPAPLFADPAERVHIVPTEYSTIQAAVEAAKNGDTILIKPGTYHEAIVVDSKSLKLTSEFATTNSPQSIERTIISGAIVENDENEGRNDFAIKIIGKSSNGTSISGLTIRDADDGINCESQVDINNCLFLYNVDAIDYEGGGGTCRNNRFERSEDDAIDLDGPCEVEIKHNMIINNLDDGIEIRLQPYDGPLLTVSIHDNVIANNAEDGIQIIDYPALTKRSIKIDNNLISNNTMAGIGFMNDAVTREDYRAADIPEQIKITGNTIAGNEVGLAASGKVKVARNHFAQNSRSAILTRNADCFSRNPTNLFWLNAKQCDKPN